MTKYMTYENSQKASKDLYEIIEEDLGSNYSLEDLEKFLLKLGSPYNLSQKYQSKSNILISGKNYLILNRLLKYFLLILFGSILIYYLAFNSNLKDLLESSKDLLLTIFFSLLISLWIAEKVKNTKILSSLLKPFEIKDLYGNREKYIFRKNKLINLILYSMIIFLNVHYLVGKGMEVEKNILQAAFFFLVLRDSNRISEGEYGKYVTILSIVCNTFVALAVLYLMRGNFNYVPIKLSYFFLIIGAIFDLLFVTKKLRTIN